VVRLIRRVRTKMGYGAPMLHPLVNMVGHFLAKIQTDLLIHISPLYILSPISSRFFGNHPISTPVTMLQLPISTSGSVQLHKKYPLLYFSRLHNCASTNFLIAYIVVFVYFFTSPLTHTHPSVQHFPWECCALLVPSGLMHAFVVAVHSPSYTGALLLADCKAAPRVQAAEMCSFCDILASAATTVWYMCVSIPKDPRGPSERAVEVHLLGVSKASNLFFGSALLIWSMKKNTDLEEVLKGPS